MDMTLYSPPIVDTATVLFISAVWIAPMGLFVLRKHLQNASGPLASIKGLLTILTAVTAPFSAMLLLVVLVGAAEDLRLLWSLLRDSW